MEIGKLAFPSDSVRCRAGDYLIRELAPGRWEVFGVDDLIILQRLIPLNGPATGKLAFEQDLLDSAAPAYMDEVQLLLTAFDAEFASHDKALAALRAGLLRPRVNGILRSLRDFPSATTRVHAEKQPR